MPNNYGMGLTYLATCTADDCLSMKLNPIKDGPFRGCLMMCGRGEGGKKAFLP